MDDLFMDSEKLYRAVYPPEIVDMFWKTDGTLSSAAFADPRGLSVDRGNYRSDKAVIADMNKRFTGRIVRVMVKDCRDVSAVVRYLPSSINRYHSEIHGSDSSALLSKTQRRYLAGRVIVL